MLITYEEKIKVKEKEIESEEDCSVTSNRMDVKKLQDAERLPGIKILSEAQFDNICEAADKNFSYITGSDALLQRKPVFQIASGSHVPDELFAVTNHGIDAGDVKKLLDAGIFTNNGLMLPTKKNFSYITGSDALLQRKPIFQITSGSEAPDELFAVSNNGINADDVKRLLDAGIFTCNGLMMHTKKSLTGIKGLSEAKVDKICEAAENIVNFGYFTGSEALLKRMAAAQITTKSQALDELLAGGIDTKAINNAFRKFRCGNTQLAHRLCVTTQLPGRMKGGNGKVAYIDTEGTFRPDRIVPIAEKFGMDPGAVLDNIIYARAYTYEHQYNLLLGLAAKMSEEPFRLLIVDSITALFRVDFTGGGELADRQQKLAQMLSLLIKIAEEFNVTVYMTNQVIADPKKPAGGRVIDGPFDNVTCAVFYDVDPYNFVDEEYMLDEDAALEAHVVGDVGAEDEDELAVSSDGDVSLCSDDDFLNEHFLFYYKQPLEVKSRIDQMPGLQSFDDLFSRAVQLVTQIETPDQVDLNRERDGEEALASFAKYYLSTPMTPRDVSGDSAIHLFYNEGFSEAIYLKLEDTENMDFDSFKPSMIKARPPSELWYSEEWVD